jgi:hypothetical protein
MFSESYLTCNLDHGADFCDRHNLKFRIYQTKNAIFELFGWGIFENDAALQKTNKDRTNTLLPPSFRQVL